MPHLNMTTGDIGVKSHNQLHNTIGKNKAHREIFLTGGQQVNKATDLWRIKSRILLTIGLVSLTRRDKM